MQGEVRFAVPGPVRAWRDETELDLGHPQQRAVLAALLVRAGAQVTLEELIDGVWGDEALMPQRNLICTGVTRARKLVVLAGSPPGAPRRDAHQRTGAAAHRA